MRNAVVLLDPVTEWKQMVDEATRMRLEPIALQISPVEDRLRQFIPSEAVLKKAGVSRIHLPMDRDVYQCAKYLQTLDGIKIKGIIPLSETAVEFSDTLGALVGVEQHNDLELVTSRREKGLMKEAVMRKGLRTAKFARVKSVAEVHEKINELGLDLPVVIKTPQGFSTTDVFICHSKEEVKDAMRRILNSRGPDGRVVAEALLEEYISGTEFAVNILAVCDEIHVTDIWKYVKTNTARYTSADICDPCDANLAALVEYAKNVARSVGIRHGAGHIEIKCRKEKTSGMFMDPCLIEVGARLSGGRKAAMVKAAVGWNPFEALIQAHIGEKVSLPESFTPHKFVRHIFFPIEKSGRVKSINLDARNISTLHSHVLMVKPGDVVQETTDITTNAGFAWLVGERKQVDQDTATLLSAFDMSIEGEA